MFGKYILHDKLGDGGYSTVYKCTDDIGIRYAVKRMPKDKNKRLRVQQEISTMKLMKNSPKIVRFVDAGEDEEAFYIVQEWCRGGDVRQYMTFHDTFVENTVASIARGVLRGLIHLHQKGVIHRDIKPGNIMVGDTSTDADVKIGDFGTAIIMDPALPEIEVDELVGTVWYLAPENSRQIYTPKSDIWSLGVMIYQLLSGRMPFNDHDAPMNPSPSKIWKSILFDDVRMNSSKWKNISDEAKDFVYVCLAKNFASRPTALELLNHDWLTKTDCNDRFKGTPLRFTQFIYDENAKTLNLDLSL